MTARLQLSRAKGFRLPTGTVRADRATILGNPWEVGTPGKLRVPGEGKALWFAALPMPRDMSQTDSVAACNRWLRDGDPLLPVINSPSGSAWVTEALEQRRDRILTLLPALRGLPFACWCQPGSPCHAHILMEIANG